ncbi:hypothetical protein IWW50_002375 [Coemansia erecta]|nr:hypothetical protein IWW50_002375 [Coemansia erecta]
MDASKRQGTLGTTLIARAKRLNYQYEVLTGIYVLDGFEKVIFNILAFVCLAFVVHMVVSGFPADLGSRAIHIL